MKRTVAAKVREAILFAPSSVHDEAAPQLRALLAVAKAADKLVLRRPGWFVVRDGIQYAKPLRLALDRLSRASAPSPRRKRT